MTSLTKRHNSTVEESVAALLSRTSNSRGLEPEVVRPRVEKALAKYLFAHQPDADRNDVRQFVSEIHADDLCLIIACERGEESAWNDLVGTFEPTVRSAARKACSDSEEADELARSVWAELYGLKTDSDGNRKGKLAYYSGRGSLAGWLRAITAQLAIDNFRKQSRFVQVEETRDFEAMAEESSNHNDNAAFVHHSDTPEEILGEKQMSEHVSASILSAIDDLDPDDKLILKLYYFDDLRLKEIARTFGYHEATASRKLVRIQSEIRKKVERSLRSKHGWKEPEVKKYLSEAATNLGVSFEKLLGLIVVAVLLQDLWY